MVSFTPQPLCLRAERLQCRLDWPQSRFWHSGEEINLFPVLEIEIRILRTPARYLVSLLTTLSLLQMMMMMIIIIEASDITLYLTCICSERYSATGCITMGSNGNSVCEQATAESWAVNGNCSRKCQRVGLFQHVRSVGKLSDSRLDLGRIVYQMLSELCQGSSSSDSHVTAFRPIVMQRY